MEDPIPFEDDTFVHGDSLDELVREAKIEHLKRYGVDELTIRELVPGGLFEKYYDQFAQMLAAGMSPEDAHEAVFHVDLRKDEYLGSRDFMTFTELGVPPDMARKVSEDLDSDQKAVMIMALGAGYELKEAYELAQKDPSEGNKEIMKFVSETEARFKPKMRDDILRERLERLRRDD